MDEETALLISQIHLDDLQELSRTAKGKQRADEVDDLQLAMSCYEAELQAFQVFIKDKLMSSSIAKAVCEDAPLIAELEAQEKQATEDRSLALHWHDGRASRPTNTMRRPPTEDEAESQQSDDELVQRLAELYMFGPDPVDQDDEGYETCYQPESSAWAASRTFGGSKGKPSIRNTDKRQCVICLNDFHFHNVVRAPCSHEYCRRCFEELFTRSLTDESLFPPRCCGQSIPINQANRIFLSPKLVGEFQAKKVERETPNPTYCYRPNCSTFIPMQFVKGDVGTCVRCSAATCTICKGVSHSGDCPEDTDTQEVLRIAMENEWQRCPSCRRVVELRTGCHHISKWPIFAYQVGLYGSAVVIISNNIHNTVTACLCRAQFCYVCAARWKTCTCPQWREDRLIERAGAVVDRNVRDRAMPAEERAQRVEQAARRLVDDHECEHNRWGRIGGPRQCEECGDTMPIWLNVCSQCHIMVCRRCRYNRL